MPPFDNVISNMEWSLKEARTELDRTREDLKIHVSTVEATQIKLQQRYEHVQELEHALAVLKAHVAGGG